MISPKSKSYSQSQFSYFSSSSSSSSIRLSSMSCSGFVQLTVAALLIQLIGLSFFIFGFFPIKPALSGFRYFPPAMLQLSLSHHLSISVVDDCSTFSGPESFRAPWNDSSDIVRDDITLSPDQRRILYQVPCLFLNHHSYLGYLKCV